MHDLDAIARNTRALMDALGRAHLGDGLAVRGWAFRYDRARRRLGRCVWRLGRRAAREITLSGPLAERLGWGVMEDVARHEIAHALDFETRGRSGHDAAWKAWARRCGADPTATYDGDTGDDPAAPYVARCPDGCGYARPFYRAPQAAYVCAACGARGARRFLRVEERATGRVLRVGGDAPGEPPRQARWVGTCPRCAATVAFGKHPTRRHACAACCRRHSGGRFDVRFELVWSRAAARGKLRVGTGEGGAGAPAKP